MHEYAGLVFAYMGPPDRKPVFPVFDTYDLPGYQLVARAPTLWDCNWLQVKENSMDPAHVAFLHTLPGSEGFSEDFKELAEWDWMETPVGMVYIDTRRYEDKVWVRVADFILPNIHQFPPNMDPVALRNAINRPQATTWAVPLDDTHTMQIGYYRAPEGKDPQRGTVFGQDGNRSYEERQRVPGDWDAQVSIHGGMARHGLEHLTSTDRGIIMMRNMIRRGIRAVGAGEESRLPHPDQWRGGARLTATIAWCRGSLRPRRRKKTGGCCARWRGTWSPRRLRPVWRGRDRFPPDWQMSPKR